MLTNKLNSLLGIKMQFNSENCKGIFENALNKKLCVNNLKVKVDKIFKENEVSNRRCITPNPERIITYYNTSKFNLYNNIKDGNNFI